MTRITSILSLLALSSLSVQSEMLYSTDFEDFPVGDNSWAGFDGWASNDLTSGAQAIDDGLFSGALGKTAALGFNEPNGPLTAVWREINYDPAESGNSLIEFQILFGIEDSTILTNFRRDDFFVSFYNISGELLAALRISNTDTDYGIWRRDGNLQEGGTETDTGQDFIWGELYVLTARIDLDANVWTAILWTTPLDGIPLFEDVTFNGTAQARTLGPIAVEWQVASGNASTHGDNWMLIADLSVETVDAPPPIVIDSIERETSGDIKITWQAYPGYDYGVEYSENLVDWLTDLPNSSMPAPASQQSFEFIDSSPAPAGRYYRVRQTRAP